MTLPYNSLLNDLNIFTSAGLGGSVGCASNKIRRLLVQPPPGRQQSFVEIEHEILSSVILALPLIQEGQLPVLTKECAQYWLTAWRTKPAW